MNEQMPSPTAPAYGQRPAGFRLPAETRLGRVRLQVADLERSLDYYERVLCFRALHRSPGFAALAPHGGDTILVELVERTGASPLPMRGRLGLYHFAILLPTRGDLGRFLRHLSEVGESAGASDHHVSEALYLRDPDGLGIEVYADRPRSQWETNGRELRIETYPMNVSAVLREGGDSPWSGIPAGTAIGHVHLHVGDLGRAAAFYHETLGLDQMTWSYPGALFLGAGGYHHHLGLNTWAGADAQPTPEHEACLLEWTIELPDAESLAALGRSLAEAGHPAEQASGPELVTNDPWGTRLRGRVARVSAEED